MVSNATSMLGRETCYLQELPLHPLLGWKTLLLLRETLALECLDSGLLSLASEFHLQVKGLESGSGF